MCMDTYALSILFSYLKVLIRKCSYLLWIK